MPLEQHVVEFRARDLLSGQMRQMSGSAQQMGQSIEQAGQRGSRSFAQFNQSAFALGSAIGATAGLLSNFARAAAEEEIVFARLEQAVENTGKSYDVYSNAIDKAIQKGEQLSFADDQVADSLARLTTVTGDAQASIDQMGLVMDFARARGISLSTSADIVGKVIGGNVGILARYGIVLEEGATATEALALIQARTAGQAESYADETQGSIDRIRNQFDNLTESIGAQTGALQTLLALAPGLSVAYSGLAGLVAGVGGFPVVAAGAAAAGAGYLTYDVLANLNQAGTSTSSSLFGNVSAGAAGFVQKVTPGGYGDALFEDIQQQYLSVINSDEFEEAARLAILQPFESQHAENLYSRLGYLIGAAPGTLSPQEIQSEIERRAQAQGYQSSGQYILATASQNPNFVQDPNTGAYVPRHVLQEQLRQQSFARIAGVPDTGVTPPSMDSTARIMAGMTRPPGPTGSQTMAFGALAEMGDLPDYQQAQNDLKAYRLELESTYGAYAGMVEGMNSVHDAHRAFKATQDGLIDDQGQYTHQLSEYQTQLGYLESAEDLLNQRREDGIALTESQVDFLSRVDEAQARLTGGTEDATLALGEQALAYAENMEKGDQMAQAFGDVGGAVTDLDSTIQELILALDGIPPEVRTAILSNAEEEKAAVDAVGGSMATLDGTNATVTVVADTSAAHASLTALANTHITIPATVAVSNPGVYQHGGVIPAAAHGRIVGGNYTLVGEAGPELMVGGQGGMVIPASASRRDRRARGDGGGITINGPITIVANDPLDFERQMRSHAIGAWA